METLKLIPVLLLSSLLVACGGDSGRTLPTPPVPQSSSSSPSSQASSLSSQTGMSSSQDSTSSASASSEAPTGPDFDFEDDVVGEAPAGLIVNVEAPGHALVSAEQAFNGTQSLKLTKPTADQLAVGRYVLDAAVSSGSVSVAVNVSQGGAGAAQTFVTLFGGDFAGSVRLIDVVFAPGGTNNLRVRPQGGGSVTADHNTGTTFTAGQWHLVEITWNNIETSQEFTLHFDGALIGTYPVAAGAGFAPDRLELKFGQTQSATYAGSAYVDDIYLPVVDGSDGGNSSAASSSSEAGDSSSSDSSEAASSSDAASSSAPAVPDFDFESDTDTLGSAPTGFDAVAGSVVVVSDEQAYTGVQSLKMSHAVSEDVRVRRQMTTAADSGSLQVAVYIPAGTGVQSFVTLYDGSYAGGERVIDIVFAGNPARQFRSRLEGVTNPENVGNYLDDAWNLIDISWENISTSNEFTLSLNGALIGTLGVAASGKTPDRLELKFGQNAAAVSAQSIYFDGLTLTGF